MNQDRMQGRAGRNQTEAAPNVKDQDAQFLNIAAARALAETVWSTLGPKGMDKMLVSSLGDVTVTNDGVTILQEMDINNPTARMIIEVAETQQNEAGDGTTTAVVIAGDLLKNAEDLLNQDIHPTTIIRGFTLASERAREEIDAIAHPVDLDDEGLLRQVGETSMTGTAVETNYELLAYLVVDAVQAVTVEAADGTNVPDLLYTNIETKEGGSVAESRVVSGGVIDKDPVNTDMQTDFKAADVLLLNELIMVERTGVNTEFQLDSPDHLQNILDSEEDQLREKVQQIKDTGADVVFSHEGIDDRAEYMLAKEGIMAVERIEKPTISFLTEVIGATLVEDLDDATTDDLGSGSVQRTDDGLFHVEGTGEESHGVTILLRGSTEHVVDELERVVEDALAVVGQTVSHGQLLAGGGHVEIELARRLRDYADSIPGREQLAVEAFADSLEVVPRLLADNAGLDPIDTLVHLRTANENGHEGAGLDLNTGEVGDTFEAGIIEPAYAKTQALASATEVATLILKIDDVISAGGLPGKAD